MDLAIFHQCYKERQATEFAISEFRLHNPDNKYYLVSDGGEDYSDIAKNFNTEWYMEDNTTMNKLSGEVALKIVNRLKKYFTISGCEYLLLMEDDIWCRGRIDIQFEFNAIGANSFGNLYSKDVVSYILSAYNIDISEAFYNLCGGSILKRDIFFNNYDAIVDFLLNHHDNLIKSEINKNYSQIYGSLDSTLNMLYIINNKVVGINPEITETWRNPDWKTNGKKLVHWYKSHYKNRNNYIKYYL